MKFLYYGWRDSHQNGGTSVAEVEDSDPIRLEELVQFQPACLSDELIDKWKGEHDGSIQWA